MFSRHYRKVKALFGLADVVLIATAFIAAYATRAWLHLEHRFFLDFPTAAMLLLYSVASYIAIGYWLGTSGRAAAPAQSPRSST